MGSMTLLGVGPPPNAIPANAVRWPDNTPAIWADSTNLLWPV